MMAFATPLRNRKPGLQGHKGCARLEKENGGIRHSITQLPSMCRVITPYTYRLSHGKIAGAAIKEFVLVAHLDTGISIFRRRTQAPAAKQSPDMRRAQRVADALAAAASWKTSGLLESVLNEEDAVFSEIQIVIHKQGGRTKGSAADRTLGIDLELFLHGLISS